MLGQEAKINPEKPLNKGHFGVFRLFVFYRCRRLRRVIDQHAVNARHLGRNAVHKVIDQL